MTPQRNVQEHDLHGRTLLVIVGRIHRAVQADREKNDCRCRKPRQHAVDDVQEARRIGEIDHSHERSLSRLSKRAQFKPRPLARK
jgi:predicted secreted Zn-dependent protease